MNPDGDFWTSAATRRALEAWISLALDEDRVDDDVTTRALFPDLAAPVRATIVAGAPGVLCGRPAATAALRALDTAGTVVESRPEGAALEPADAVLVWTGGVGSVLAAERTALNILSHLSGIATRVRRAVELAPEVQILDTRKTLPGLRLFQKYAVRVGGGHNHRGDLAEFALVKDNHRALYRARRSEDFHAEIGGIMTRLRAGTSGLVEIEVEDFDSFVACLARGVDVILLDNQPAERITRWMRAARDIVPAPWSSTLEASGGITDDTLRAYADCGVTRISLGDLTHSVRALDFSLEVEWV